MRTKLFRRSGSLSTGFTLVELLVVVAIIALLLSILLPSLSGARKQARTLVCASHLSDVGKMMYFYLGQYNDVYPASYFYANDAEGRINLDEQYSGSQDALYGYIHWSWMLYGNGAGKENSFTCPEIPRGGLARTNPGDQYADIEPGQVLADPYRTAPYDPPTDRQARRIAYAANGLIMPRNKFTHAASGGQRINRFVNSTQLTMPEKTVLMTEYIANYRVNSKHVAEAGSMLGYQVKSHRPIVPAYHLGWGKDEYGPPETNGSYLYSEASDYGLLPYGDLMSSDAISVVDQPGVSEANLVGRHHQEETAQWLYIDSHVERKHVREIYEKKEWGDRYYSLSGCVGFLADNQYSPKWQQFDSMTMCNDFSH
ncbi:MAG: hypothetical protein HJJLKODD_01382 [Phycisphaerae bacterium]|nr:hypothetical protein [Phycisphaerae bacterium]